MYLVVDPALGTIAIREGNDPPSYHLEPYA